MFSASQNYFAVVFLGVSLSQYLEGNVDVTVDPVSFSSIETYRVPWEGPMFRKTFGGTPKGGTLELTRVPCSNNLLGWKHDKV